MTSDELDTIFGDLPVRFGLTAQGHIPTIEAMLYAGCTWNEIGRQIGWMPEAAKENWRWLQERINK